MCKLEEVCCSATSRLVSKHLPLASCQHKTAASCLADGNGELSSHKPSVPLQREVSISLETGCAKQALLGCSVTVARVTTARHCALA
jgi:hypothetical protein